jgi:hypothetical protein
MSWPLWHETQVDVFSVQGESHVCREHLQWSSVSIPVLHSEVNNEFKSGLWGGLQGPTLQWFPQSFKEDVGTVPWIPYFFSGHRSHTPGLCIKTQELTNQPVSDIQSNFLVSLLFPLWSNLCRISHLNFTSSFVRKWNLFFLILFYSFIPHGF